MAGTPQRRAITPRSTTLIAQSTSLHPLVKGSDEGTKSSDAVRELCGDTTAKKRDTVDQLPLISPCTDAQETPCTAACEAGKDARPPSACGSLPVGADSQTPHAEKCLLLVPWHPVLSYIYIYINKYIDK